MGYRHSQDDLLDAAVEVVLEQGWTALTFGAVSRRLGIADRTVVYYFPTKDDLVAAVLARTTAGLQELLTAAVGERPASDAVLLQRAWTALSAGSADAAVSVYVECVGLAVRGREPYRGATERLVAGWSDWVAARLTGPRDSRADRAHALVATLDGLLLLRAGAGARPAEAAARGLGLRVPDPVAVTAAAGTSALR